jgi:hypothetical protein
MAQEKEMVIVCKIGDFEGLKSANYTEEQEQLELFCPQKGRIRVRKTVSEDGTDYVACIKTLADPTMKVKTVEETEQQVNSQFFEAFRFIAEHLRVKKRYVFEGEKSVITAESKEIQLPPIKYEVDVFTKPDGSISQWCKIDIELGDFYESLKSMNNVPEDEDIDFVVKVTHLPFKPQMAYILGACTDEQLKASKELWEKEWTQTPFGKAITATQASVSDLPVNSQQPQENQTEAENDETEQQQHI